MKYLLLCLIFPALSFCQGDKQLYSIYSEVLNNDLRTFYGINKDSIKQLVLITDCKSVLKMFSGSIISTFSKDTILAKDEWAFNFVDTNLIATIKTEPDLRKAFKKLITISDNYFPLEPEKFLLQNTFFNIVGMSHKKFESYFTNSRDINKSWTKLKSQYVFEFSEIACVGDYAVVYFGRYCGGLCGSGDVFILIKENNVWHVLGKINEWMA